MCIRDRSKADAIIADAQAKAQELVTQHEIMQKAYAQANDTINAANKQAQEILDSATQDANSIDVYKRQGHAECHCKGKCGNHLYFPE